MTHAPGMKARKAPESIGAKAASHSAIRKRRRSNGAVARAASEERLDLSGLTCWVGFMLRVVQVRVFQRYYENPIGREISPGALSTLTAIAANPGVRPGALVVSVGSSLQIALFVAPVLVLISHIVGTPMDLVFTQLEIATVALAVVLTALIALDGESNWLEGALLMIVYAILAVSFFEFV